MVYNGKSYENVYFMENPKQKWMIYDDLGYPHDLGNIQGPNNTPIIYLSPEDERKHWLYAAILTLGFRI